MSWFRRGAKVASSSSHATQARTDATCYCTLNVATAVIDPPRVQDTSPGDVFAVMLAVEPGIAGPGRLTNSTESEAGRGATVGFGVGRGVGRTVGGGVVAPAASGIP